MPFTPEMWRKWRARDGENEERKRAREAAQRKLEEREAEFRAQSEAFTEQIRQAYDRILATRPIG